MKKIIKKIFIIFSRIFLSLFYNKNYLNGRYFSKNDISGWIWAYRCLVDQKIKGYNKHISFPVHPTTVVGKLDNLIFDINDENDARGKIEAVQSLSV